MGEPANTITWTGVPTLARQEGVIVRDHDLGPLELLEQIRREQVELAVVVLGIVR